MTERKRRLRTGATLAILAVLALVALWCDINAGYRSISLEELGQILSGTASQSLTYTLVALRLPRVLTSLLVGVGLSLSGCLLQGVSRNDMADPGVLGINAGAGLLVAAFIVFVPAGIFPSAVALPLLAFAGSAAVAFLGWRLSVVRGASSPRRLLLIGVALATGLSSATSLLMLRMSDGDYAFVQNWLAGSIWGASWENVALLAVGLAVLTAGAFYASRTLNVLGLGPAAATGLGVNVPRATAALTAVAVGASGLACAVGGGLTFVGLVCPHMARRLVGPNFRALVPACVLVGAVLMLRWPTSSRARCIAPGEIRRRHRGRGQSATPALPAACWRRPEGGGRDAMDTSKDTAVSAPEPAPKPVPERRARGGGRGDGRNDARPRAARPSRWATGRRPASSPSPWTWPSPPARSPPSIGPNGCGKSTLLKALSRTAAPARAASVLLERRRPSPPCPRPRWPARWRFCPSRPRRRRGSPWASWWPSAATRTRRASAA